MFINLLGLKGLAGPLLGGAGEFFLQTLETKLTATFKPVYKLAFVKLNTGNRVFL